MDLVKAGAADYLAKPWDDRKLLTTVNNLLELSEARRELDRRRSRELRQRNALEENTSSVARSLQIRPASASSRSPARSRAPNCRC